MIKVLFVVFQLSMAVFATSCFSSGTTEFVEASFYNKPISQVIAKYGAQSKEDCPKETSERCLKKYHSNCNCYSVTLRDRNYGNAAFMQMLFFIEQGGITRKVAESIQVVPGALKPLNKLETYTGNSKPDSVLKGRRFWRNSAQQYIAQWKLDNGAIAWAQIGCPLEVYGGVLKDNTALRNCKVLRFLISELDDETKPTNGIEKVDKDY